MSQKEHEIDWQQITLHSQSDDVHKQRTSILDAQFLFEQFLESENIEYVKGNLPTALNSLVERGYITEAAEFIRLKSAINIRNGVVHHRLLSQERIIEVVLAYRELVTRCHSQSNRLESKTNQKDIKDVALHERLSFQGRAAKPEAKPLVGNQLPPPPNVSYHPAFYIHREPEEKRALTCLLYAGNPVVIQAPQEFGKRTLVSYLLETIGQLINVSVLQFDGAKISSLADFNNQLNLKNGPENSAVGLSMRSFLEKRKNILVLVIENVDAVIFSKLSIARELSSLSKLEEEPWTRLRLLFTASSSRQELRECGVIDIDNFILLDEFNSAQVEQLAALHGFCDKDVEDLWDLVGGHPYLIRLGLFQSYVQGISPSELISQDEVFTRYKEAVIRSIKEHHFSSLDNQRILKSNLSSLKFKEYLFSSPVILDFCKRGIMRQEKENYYPRCLLYKEMLSRLVIDNNLSIDSQVRAIAKAEEARKAEAKRMEEKRKLDEAEKARMAEEKRKQDIAKRAEELILLYERQQREERESKAKQIEEARQREEARQKEEAKQREKARLRKIEEDIKIALEEESKREAVRKVELRKIEEAKQREEAREAEEISLSRLIEEARRKDTKQEMSATDRAVIGEARRIDTERKALYQYEMSATDREVKALYDRLISYRTKGAIEAKRKLCQWQLNYKIFLFNAVYNKTNGPMRYLSVSDRCLALFTSDDLRDLQGDRELYHKNMPIVSFKMKFYLDDSLIKYEYIECDKRISTKIKEAGVLIDGQEYTMSIGVHSWGMVSLMMEVK